jgi:hypothetical protein
VTGSNFEHQSFAVSNNRASENTGLSNLDSDTKGRFVGLFGLAIFSVYVAVSLSANFYFSVISAHWPTTIARVVSSGVYTNGKGVGVSWTPKVEYEYEVGGTTHHSEKIRFLMRTFYDQDSAADVEAPYAAARSVSVFYDPQDPDRSVLEPGIPPGMWTQGLIALFFFGLCAYIFFEITHPERRLLLHSNPTGERNDEERSGDPSQLA